MLLPVRFLRAALAEYLEYDSRAARAATAGVGLAVGAALWHRPDKRIAFRLFEKVHRSGNSDRAAASIEARLRASGDSERAGRETGLWNLYRQHVRMALGRAEARSIVANPTGLFGYRVLVLKSAEPGERGVIALDYSYVFPLFAALFDIEAISHRYHLVLEPSWRGICTADVLAYSVLDTPVFVETAEPRDRAFLEGLNANLLPVPIAANWWVDHRVVTPRPRQPRDLDIVMVAAWSALKRHWRFFRALQQLRKRGLKPRVALIGYPLDRSQVDIAEDARALGVLDGIEFHEGLSFERVGELLCRSKVHVLWSRKEGANRAAIEALFADVPIVLRRGLSYGHEYPYVNGSTGRFSTEESLPDDLEEILSGEVAFTPRAWAMQNMTCQRATAVLEDTIRRVAEANGERWTSGLVVKTVHLDSQRYWDPQDRIRFARDYDYLSRQLRPSL